MPKSALKRLTYLAVSAALFGLFGTSPVRPQISATTPTASEKLTISTDSVGPVRFVAVHGQRSAIMGYGQDGLEIWAWPFRLLREYRIKICPRGAATEIDGERLLRRIEYRPDSVTRIYAGPDFIVRETLFVPLDQPGAIITYKVEGRGHVDISLHFFPVLDLMWPASIGGQSTAWNATLSGYVMSDEADGYLAAITSPDAVAHDSPENSAIRYHDGLTLTVRPNPSAEVFVGLDHGSGPGTLVRQLAAQKRALEEKAAAHYAGLLRNAVQIETPDEDVNRALAWSEIALEQAWVCNPDLGCGLVAGYGPSRNARRPQYAWFFAGDGLVATDGLVAAGEYDRARAELEFILKYQDRKTGMIWHELSQSAGQIDWAGKYPYMFVHVDITFQFLSTVAQYVEASGDIEFAKRYWDSLESAYRYCRSLVDPATSLPRIPPDKEGSNEQDRQSDELSLSAAWLDASSAFAKLAEWSFNPQEAEQASTAVPAARQSIASRYWDGGRQFWISGHTLSGKEIFDERSSPMGLIAKHVFSAQQDRALLDKIASSKFQTDWGSRGLSSSSSAFDPDSYAKGSVFALNTTNVTEAFWNAHRSSTAFTIWSSLIPWTWLDSPGHIHEVLAGDSYHQQTESVPEQTWSSAGLISATVRGLLGIQIDSVSNRIIFSPHLPPEWHDVTLHNIRVQHAAMDVELQKSEEIISVSVTNQGNPTSFVFDPQIPSGASIIGAECENRGLPVSRDHTAQDEHARLAFTAPNGTIHCGIRYRGGVEILSPHPVPVLGNPSTGVKITSADLEGSSLTIEADVNESGAASVEVQSQWNPVPVEGATLVRSGADRYRIDFAPVGSSPDSFGYTHRRAVIHFTSRTPK